MTRCDRFVFLLTRSLAVLLTAFAISGCGGSEPQSTAASSEPVTGESTDAEPDESAATPFVLGDLLEPFDPPSLEQLLAENEWIDNPVRDGIELMRDLLAEQPAPELSPAEALKLRNDSPEANAQIRAAMGQLAPEDGSGVNDDATFVRHVSGDLKSINPLLKSAITEFEYHDLASVKLVKVDARGGYFAHADWFESWQTSEDRLIDKFVLRDDLRWSDGTPVTAQDFEFTFKTIMTKAVIVPALRQGPDEMRAVVAYDDRTIVAFHKEALASNNESLQFEILPKHLYEKTVPEDPTLARSEEHSRLEDDPVTCGPYELAERSRGEEFVMRRREGYYLVDGEQVRPKPYLKEIRIKYIEDSNTALFALKEGDIEEMMLRPEHWVTQTTSDGFYERNTKVNQTQWTEFHFMWNMQSPLFEDQRVRWAMTYALDYPELLETICYGLYQQGLGIYHPDSWMFPKEGIEPIEQDLDKAQQLLGEAGWEDTDGDGVLDKEIDGRRVPFEFTMLTYSTKGGIETATVMKESLDLIGVICNVKPTEFTVLVQKTRDKEFEAAMGGWGSGTDPFTNKNIWGTDEGRNYVGFSSEEVDRLFEEGKREFDREKRAEIYGRIHKLIWDEQPYTWLYYRNSFYAFNKKLRGYNFSPWGPYNYCPGAQSVFVPLN